MAGKIRGHYYGFMDGFREHAGDRPGGRMPFASLGRRQKHVGEMERRPD